MNRVGVLFFLNAVLMLMPASWIYWQVLMNNQNPMQLIHESMTQIHGMYLAIGLSTVALVSIMVAVLSWCSCCSFGRQMYDALVTGDSINMKLDEHSAMLKENILKYLLTDPDVLYEGATMKQIVDKHLKLAQQFIEARKVVKPLERLRLTDNFQSIEDPVAYANWINLCTLSLVNQQYIDYEEEQDTSAPTTDEEHTASRLRISDHGRKYYKDQFGGDFEMDKLNDAVYQMRVTQNDNKQQADRNRQMVRSALLLRFELRAVLALEQYPTELLLDTIPVSMMTDVYQLSIIDILTKTERYFIEDKRHPYRYTMEKLTTKEQVKQHFHDLLWIHQEFLDIGGYPMIRCERISPDPSSDSSSIGMIEKVQQEDEDIVVDDPGTPMMVSGSS